MAGVHKSYHRYVSEFEQARADGGVRLFLEGCENQIRANPGRYLDRLFAARAADLLDDIALAESHYSVAAEIDVGPARSKLIAELDDFAHRRQRTKPLETATSQKAAPTPPAMTAAATKEALTPAAMRPPVPAAPKNTAPPQQKVNATSPQKPSKRKKAPKLSPRIAKALPPAPPPVKPEVKKDSTRVFVLAREMNADSQEILTLCKTLGIPVKNILSQLDSVQHTRVRDSFAKAAKSPTNGVATATLPQSGPPSAVKQIGRPVVNHPVAKPAVTSPVATPAVKAPVANPPVAKPPAAPPPAVKATTDPLPPSRPNQVPPQVVKAAAEQPATSPATKTPTPPTPVPPTTKIPTILPRTPPVLPGRPPQPKPASEAARQGPPTIDAVNSKPAPVAPVTPPTPTPQQPAPPRPAAPLISPAESPLANLPSPWNENHLAVDLVGRETLFKKISRRLHNRDGNIWLFGMSRSGKTSFLRHLVSRLQMKPLESDLNRRFFAVQWDFAEAANYKTAQLWNYLLKDCILEQLFVVARQHNIKLSTSLGSLDVESPDFADLKRIILDLRKIGLHPIFVIDEFTYYKQLHRYSLDPSFLAWLRDRSNDNQIACVFSNLVNSEQTIMEFAAEKVGITGQFANINEYEVGPIDDADARQLIRKLPRLKFTAAAEEHILKLSNRYPYFIHIVCKACFDLASSHALDVIDAPEVEKVAEALTNPAAAIDLADLKRLLLVKFNNNLYHKDQSEDHLIMSLICQLTRGQSHPEPIERAEIQKSLNSRRIEFPGLFDTLHSMIQRRILTDLDHGGRKSVAVGVDLYRRWWAHSNYDLDMQTEMHTGQQSRSRTREHSSKAGIALLRLLEGKRSPDVPRAREGPPFALADYPHDPASFDQLEQTTIWDGLAKMFSAGSKKDVDWESEDIGDLVFTLKSLFYLFQGACPETYDELQWPKPPSTRAARKPILNQPLVECLLRLLIKAPAGLEFPEVVLERPEIRLPSWPGIRFLVSLGQFLTAAVNESGDDLAQPMKILFAKNRIEIEWSTSDFPRKLVAYYREPDLQGGNVVGHLKKLINCDISIPKGLDSRISNYLTDPECVPLIKPDHSIADRPKSLVLTWGA